MSFLPVSDAPWSIIVLRLPAAVECPQGGRPHLAERPAPTGTLLGLQPGMQRKTLCLEMEYGSEIISWRRLGNWQAADVWDDLHRNLLDQPRGANRIDSTRACIDSASLAAKTERQDRAEPD